MNKFTLIENWRKVARHSSVIKLALAGVFGPELVSLLLKLISPEIMQLVADNLHLLPWLPEDWKDFVRLLILAVIPFARVRLQKSLSGELAAPRA